MTDDLKPRRGSRLSPLVTLIGAIAILVAGVAMAVYEEHLYKEQKLHSVEVQARILASSVTAALMFDDQRTTQEYLNALRAGACRRRGL